MCVCVCVCVCMYVEKVKRKKSMFDGLFRFDFNLFLHAKVLYQNYFSMKNNYER